MKNLFVLILLVAISYSAAAQKDSLALDEHGKYIYYSVVNLAKGDQATLYTRAVAFVKTAVDTKTLKITAYDGKTHIIDGTGYFTVSKQASFARHDDGKITYTLRIETKDQKYRYWLTDFVFTPYVKDRYNNFVPQPGMDFPVEKFTKKMLDKDATRYLDECGTFARMLGLKLKKYMDAEATIKKADGKKVIKIEKW